MRLSSIPRTWRHMRRYRQIVSILLKYGFDDIVGVIRQDLVMRFGSKIVPRLKVKTDVSMSRPERLRYAAEELGPAFVKLGQILSMRPDLVPPDIATEFQKLQDEVTPCSYEEILTVIREELKQEPEMVFAEICDQPLAAASIAQVYRATLPTGQRVVLKVQRPGIRDVIDVDLEIISDLAQILARHSPNTIMYDPVGIVTEFDRSIHRELDFLSEARNIQRFGRLCADDTTVFIPTAYLELSSPRLLVMDFVDGVKVSRLDEISKMNLDQTIIAKRGANLILKQIFEFGFFHADPHPGNIMVIEDNVIAPLDYGMVGHLDQHTIDGLGDVLIGIVKKDVRRILKSFDSLEMSRAVESRDALQMDLSDFINRYYEVPLQQLQVSSLLGEIFEIARLHHLVVPSNMSLMLKALVTVEGLGRKLYPEFDMVSEVRPYINRITMKRYDPRRKFRELISILDDFSDLAEELPQGIRDIMRKTSRGELKVQFEHRNLDNIAKKYTQSSNRTSSALIIAALIIGSSLVMQVPLSPSFFGFPLLGVIGYILASMFGIMLLWDIFRSRRQ